MKAVHVSTFSGIGGFDLAAEAVGWENIAHCEINPFGQRVLKHYWPEALSFSDITKIGNEEAEQIKQRAGTTPIVFSGGFPCQPFSSAGKRQGSDDDRHLWPEVIRVVGLVQPRVVVFENVFGLTSILEQACYTAMEREVVRLFSEDNDSQDVVETIERIHQRTLGIIVADLEEAGYTLPYTQSGEPIILCVPAASVGAPHRRDRVWIVAYANQRNDGGAPRQNEGDGEKERLPKRDKVREFSQSDEVRRPTPNPHNPRTDNTLRSNGNGQEGKRGRQQELESGPACRDAADAYRNERPKRGLHTTKQEAAERYAGTRDALRHRSGAWENFPTQPPVCRGNDGFSSELAGITFSRWRNESIKAYGNAIVPQVAIELFKAINETL